METLEQPGAARPLLVVGGNLALDFANTVDDPGGPAQFDHLGDAERLLAWARNRGLLGDPGTSAAVHADPRRVRRLQQLRSTVQGGFTELAHGRPFPAPVWHELRRSVGGAVGAAELHVGAGRARVSWPGDDLDAVGHAVAYAALELLTGEHLPRIKQCASCPWLFVDRSRNGSRRWCSMADCGTSAKIDRYVARRAERRARS